MSYVGRFAPSPSGPLHFGSLVAALASFLDARQQSGRWLLRIEDLDPPREVSGAADLILTTLERYGLFWDGPVVYQSQRSELYLHALQQLQQGELLYPCTCTRKRLRPLNGYDGHCRQRVFDSREAAAWRLRVNAPELIAFDDRLQGQVSQDIGVEGGDFIVRRKDGYFAYQLAVVVDDDEQQITHVVRGADLLDSTPRQIYLQRLLGLKPVRYAHIPVLLDANGQKLSKQNHAPALDQTAPEPVLSRALVCLGMLLPAGLVAASITEQLQWAIEHWCLERQMSAQVAIPERVWSL